METKVLNLSLDTNKRLLFISDIHGNVHLFQKILEKNKFNDDDYLFINGDIIEKSDTSIQMLDVIMELSKKPNVYVLCGNCDDVLLHMIPPVNGDLLKYYALERKKTIINDFARKLNKVVTLDTDMNSLCELFYKKFRKYYDFVESLYHVAIINNKLVVCHGGLDSIDDIPKDAIKVMKYDNFYATKNKLEYKTIVGHYPTINYTKEIPSLNPIIDLDKNLISIDGGNNLIMWGQLNLFIIENLDSMKMSYNYLDEFKVVKVKEDFTHENINLYNITQKPIEVEIIKDLDDYCIVKTIDNNEVYVLKENLYYSENKKKLMAFNGFNYFLNVKKGDLVSLCTYRKEISVIKKDGIVGLIYTKYLEV